MLEESLCYDLHEALGSEDEEEDILHLLLHGGRGSVSRESISERGDGGLFYRYTMICLVVLVHINLITTTLHSGVERIFCPIKCCLKNWIEIEDQVPAKMSVSECFQ